MDQFTAECEATGRRIITYKSETTVVVVVVAERMECYLQVKDEILPQMEAFIS